MYAIFNNVDHITFKYLPTQLLNAQNMINDIENNTNYNASLPPQINIDNNLQTELKTACPKHNSCKNVQICNY